MPNAQFDLKLWTKKTKNYHPVAAAAKNGICAKHAKIWWVAQLDDPCIKLDFSGDKNPDNRET